MVKKVVKRIPATENGNSVTYTAMSGTKYRITKHVGKPLFYLWRVVDGGYERVCQMETPYDLYVVIDEMEGL